MIGRARGRFLVAAGLAAAVVSPAGATATGSGNAAATKSEGVAVAGSVGASVASPVDGYSAADLYNRANAHARAGQLGLAVLGYERASLLTPADPDVEANLAIARARAHVAAEPARRFTLRIGAASREVFAWLGVLGVALLGGGALIARRYRAGRMWRIGALLTGVLLILLPVADALTLWPTLHAAVVLAGSAPVRAAPVPMGDAVFQLTEADTVRVLAEHEDFVLIQTQGGRRGWMARADLGFVLPR
jgi:hypothetical protein